MDKDHFRVLVLSILVIGVLATASFFVFTSQGNLTGAAIAEGETPTSPVFILIFSTIVVLVGFAAIFFIWEYGITAHKLDRHLKKIGANAHNIPLEDLKVLYKDVHQMYSKLSEGEKEKFFHHLNKVRGFIEEQMHAGKELEEHLSATETSFTGKRSRYLKAHKAYMRLSPKEQERFYHHLVSMRQELEGGTS